MIRANGGKPSVHSHPGDPEGANGIFDDTIPANTANIWGNVAPFSKFIFGSPQLQTSQPCCIRTKMAVRPTRPMTGGLKIDSAKEGGCDSKRDLILYSWLEQ